jgi:hypothetical protein
MLVKAGTAQFNFPVPKSGPIVTFVVAELYCLE